MKLSTKIIASAAALAIGVVALSGCGATSDYQARKDKQADVTLSNSLGIEAQKERLKREDNPSAIRYVYLMSFGDIVGYYVIKGKVADAGTQLAPEQDIVCRFSSDSCQAVDSAKDDGTFGGDDAGVFFFTSDGILVETTLDYVQSDAPLAVDVPRLGGVDK